MPSRHYHQRYDMCEIGSDLPEQRLMSAEKVCVLPDTGEICHNATQSRDQLLGKLAVRNSGLRGKDQPTEQSSCKGREAREAPRQRTGAQTG